MAPEYGATCGFFPTDLETINYLKLSGKSKEHLNIVEQYAKKQTIWLENSCIPIFNENIDLDLSTVETSVAGPKSPQDKVLLKNIPKSVTPIISEHYQFK